MGLKLLARRSGAASVETPKVRNCYQHASHFFCIFFLAFSLHFSMGVAYFLHFFCFFFAFARLGVIFLAFFLHFPDWVESPFLAFFLHFLKPGVIFWRSCFNIALFLHLTRPVCITFTAMYLQSLWENVPLSKMNNAIGGKFWKQQWKRFWLKNVQAK